MRQTVSRCERAERRLKEKLQRQETKLDTAVERKSASWRKQRDSERERKRDGADRVKDRECVQEDGKIR